MHHTSKKGSKKEINNNNNNNNKVTKNFLQVDLNPDPQNQLELKGHTSVHWTTSVSADGLSLKEVYIPSLW